MEDARPQEPKEEQNPSNGSQELRRIGVLIEDLDHKITLVAEQYGGIKKALDTHTEMIAAITVDLEIIKTDTEFIKNSLKKKVDVEEFAALERRVALLEKRRKSERAETVGALP